MHAVYKMHRDFSPTVSIRADLVEQKVHRASVVGIELIPGLKSWYRKVLQIFKHLDPSWRCTHQRSQWLTS